MGFDHTAQSTKGNMFENSKFSPLSFQQKFRNLFHKLNFHDQNSRSEYNPIINRYKLISSLMSAKYIITIRSFYEGEMNFFPIFSLEK